jgi:K+-transporting ATPase ATPase B chain
MGGVPAPQLRKGDVFLVEAGDAIPADGEVIDGVASVDESAITGESAPVVRESGGDFSAVTGGTRVLSDWLVVRVAVNPGEAFIDRMIAMVEGAKRQKTPNEIALTILLIALTLVFLLATATLLPFSLFSVEVAKAGHPVTITVLVALLVCLIPTTIGGLLSAIGVAGMSRMMASNVIATSGRAVEAAGDVDVLLLDKTGTITWAIGRRPRSARRRRSPSIAVGGCRAVEFARGRNSRRPQHRGAGEAALQSARAKLESTGGTFVPFSAQTRMSGVNVGSREVRKGAAQAIRQYVEALGLAFPAEVSRSVDEVARQGSTPLVVTDGGRCWASSNSRTSSRAASRSASASCAAWAFAPS